MVSYNEFDDLDHIESKGMTFDFKGFLFKVLVAFLDTPLCYLGVWGVRRLINPHPAL